MSSATRASASSRRSAARGPAPMISTSSVCASSGTRRSPRGTRAPRRRRGPPACRRRRSLAACASASTHDVDRGVEQREDALLLVGEVLVERRLRHAGLARDRLRARVGVADAREDGGGRREQPRALAILTDLERRRVAAARDAVSCSPISPDGRGTTLGRPHGPRSSGCSRSARHRARGLRAAGDVVERVQGRPRRRSPQVIEDLQSDAAGPQARRRSARRCSSRALADKLKLAATTARPRSRSVASDADDFELEVDDVTIDGTTATAKVTSGTGGKTRRRDTFALVREDGDWRLTRPRLERQLAQRAPVLALVVRAVVAGADRLPPVGVLAVPGDRVRRARRRSACAAPSRARAPSPRTASSGGRGRGGR